MNRRWLLWLLLPLGAVALFVLVRRGASAPPPVAPAEPVSEVAAVRDVDARTDANAAGRAVEAGADAAGRVVEVESTEVRVDAVDFAAMVVGLRDDWLYAAVEDLDASMASVFAVEHRETLREAVLVNGIGAMREALATAPTLAPTWYMTVPLTAGEVTSPDIDLHIVEVWEMQVFSRDGVSEPTASWSLHLVTVRPMASGWEVTDWTVAPGPAPGLDGRQVRTDAAVLDVQLQDHGRLYRDAMQRSIDSLADADGSP